MSGAGPRHSRPAGRRAVATSLLPALALSLAACGFNKQDLRYRDSQLHETLQVPADLAEPVYTTSMEIPAVPAAPAAAPAAGDDIELPPDLRAGAPAAGAE